MANKREEIKHKTNLGQSNGALKTTPFLLIINSLDIEILACKNLLI
jgi:hypothetical protein